MKIELKYFSGTGNSYKILSTTHDFFIENNHVVSLSSIGEEKELPPADLYGFCFPVYAFAIPRIVRKYLNSIKQLDNPQKAFVIITAGYKDESGFSVSEAVNILRRKKIDVIYSDVIQMPVNWITSPVPPYPPSKEEATVIVNEGVNQAKQMAAQILKGTRKTHVFNYPKRYSKIKFYWEYCSFRYAGIQNLWRNFRTYDTCNGCGVCMNICPTKSIRMENNRPMWTSSCEQCMRCANLCINDAIYQTMGGDTRGKHRYFVPAVKSKMR